MRRNRIILRGNVLISVVVNLLATQQALLPRPPQSERTGNIAGHKILKVYDYQNSGLKVSPPRSIFQDKMGRFWIGGGGEIPLQAYDPLQNQWTSFGEENDGINQGLHYRSGALLPFSVESIYQTQGGDLWFAGSKKSASRHPFISSFDGREWQKKVLEVDSGQYNAIGLFPGNKGTLWLWVNDELFKYNDKQWLRRLKLSEKVKNAPLPNPPYSNVDEKTKAIASEIAKRFEIYSGIQDQTGVVWLGTRQGIVKYDEKKNELTYTQAQASSITTIYEDTARRLWFLNNLGKIYVHDTERNSWSSYDIFKLLPSIIPNDSTKALRAFLLIITRVYLDRFDQMLFATDRGLIVYTEREKKWELMTTENSILPDSYVTTILEDKSGRVWIGTRKGILMLA